MNEQSVIDIANNTMWITMLIAAPSLIAALIMGLVISIFQAATQINEQTLSFIPKVFFMMVAMALTGPWLLQKLMGFTVAMFQEIPNVIH